MAAPKVFKNVKALIAGFEKGILTKKHKPVVNDEDGVVTVAHIPAKGEDQGEPHFSMPVDQYVAEAHKLLTASKA